MRRQLVALALLCTAFRLNAQEILIAPARDGTIQTDPRSNVSLVVDITNTSQSDRLVRLTTSLPDEWRELVPGVGGTVAADSTTTRIVSIFVPQEAGAGIYSLTVSAIDGETGERLAQLPVAVEVLPHVELEMTILDGSSYVITGEVIELPYRVSNASNMDLLVTLSHRSVYDYEARFLGAEGDTVRIPANSSVRIVVQIQTGGFIGRVIDYNVNLVAQGVPIGELESGAGLSATVSERARVEIIPEVSEEPPPWHTLSSLLSLSSSHSFGDTWDGAVSADLHGSGSLDPEGVHHVDFKIAPTVDLDLLQFGLPQDDYHLAYSNDFVEVRAGNEGYTVSPLLASYLAGWGILGRITPGPFTFTSLYSAKEEEAVTQSTVASMLQYRLVDPDRPGLRYQSSINGIWQIGDRWLGGTYHQFDNGAGLSADLDVALGGMSGGPFSWAVSAEAEGEYAGFGLAGAGRYASPDFPSTETDRYFYSLSVDTPQFRDVAAFHAAYTQQQSNLSLNPALSSAPRIIGGRLSASFAPGDANVNLSGGWHLEHRLDMLGEPTFDALTNSLTAGAILGSGPVTFRIGARWQLEHDRLLDSWEFLHRYDGQIGFSTPSERQYTTDLKFEGERSGDDVKREYSASATIEQSVDPIDWSTTATVDMTRLGGEFQSLTARVGGELSLAVGARSTLSFAGHVQYRQTTQGPEFSGAADIGFTTPLSIPVSRQRDVGAIEGYVYDAASGLPLEDVIIRMSDRAVVSGERGLFKFTGLAEGDYYLEINASRVGRNRIADLPSPIVVHVVPDRSSHIEIPIIEGGIVSGRVKLYEVAAGSQGLLTIVPEGQEAPPDYTMDELVEAGGLSGVIIHLRQGDQLRRVLTRADGDFVFYDVRPGTWTVTLETERLPRYHRLLHGVEEIEVASGETAELEFEVVPVRRTLTIISAPPIVVETAVEPEAEPEAEAEPEPEVEPGPEPEPDIGEPVEEASAEEQPVVQPEAELGPGLSDRDQQHFRELRTVAPQILGLPWGATPDQVETYLAGRIDPLELDNSAPDRDGRIALATSGVVQLGLLGDIALTFLDPNANGSELFLIRACVQITAAENLLSPARLRELYLELLALFVNHWKVADMEVERIGSTERQSANIAGIDAEFAIDYNEVSISLCYSDPWYRE
jgi:hypothetical protein